MTLRRDDRAFRSFSANRWFNRGKSTVKPIAAIVILLPLCMPLPAAGGCLSAATDIFVSPTGTESGVGSASSPFRTIVAAAGVAKPGTTVHVAAGVYAGSFMTWASGTGCAPITYVSDPLNAAKIVGGGSAKNPNKAGWENRGDYVIVKGFEIDGSGNDATSWAFGFYNGGSHVTFLDNRVHDIMTDWSAFKALTAGRMGGAGIMMDGYYGGTDGSIVGNIVYNIGPAGGKSRLVHGLYQTETGRILGNIVYDVVGAGIHLWHGAQHVSIQDNTVDGAAGDAGILVGSGDRGSSGATGDYISVVGNIVINSAAGIREAGTTGLHNLYIDNLLYNNGTPEISLQNRLVARHTVFADPLFVDRANHDYHLSPGSPAATSGALATTSGGY